MFAVGILIAVSAFPGSAAPADWPPRTTVAELNAMVKAGNYHLIRKQKIAHQLEAVGVVDKVGRQLLLKLPGDWWAILHNVGEDHGLKPGDRVKFRALIVDEAYMGLQLWTYSWSKVPTPKAGQSQAVEPRPSLAAAVAELKKYSCHEIDTGTVTGTTRHLSFGCHSNLPDLAFALLAAFPELEDLDFISDKVTDACLVPLQKLPRLRALHINSSTITDRAMDYLKDLPRLEELSLMRTQVTAKGLVKVQELRGLKGLVLMRIATTPAMIEQLKRFKHLHKLYIGQTRFTVEQERELRAALPNLSIHQN